MDENQTPPTPASLDILDEIPFRITAVLGATELSGRQLKELSEGATLDLERVPESPLVVLANGQPVALADPIVTEDQFGVRIRSVLSEKERRAYRDYERVFPGARVVHAE